MTQLDRKWGLAAVESDKPAIPLKTYQASRLYRKRKPQRSVKVRLRNVAVSPCISPRCSNNTKLSDLIVERVQTRCLIADVSSKHPSLQSLLHFGYWTFPQSAKLHQAALRLQVNFPIHDQFNRDFTQRNKDFRISQKHPKLLWSLCGSKFQMCSHSVGY